MSRTAFCSAPIGAELPDPGDLLQLFRGRFDGFEGCHAECGDNSRGELGTNAPDHAGAEIFFDARRGRRRRCRQKILFELKTMGAVVDPDADGVNIFARGNRRGVADDRYEIALAAGFHLQDREPILLIVERHALHRADERFPRGAALRRVLTLHGEALALPRPYGRSII
jgi:hypothetical protein